MQLGKARGEHAKKRVNDYSSENRAVHFEWMRIWTLVSYPNLVFLRPSLGSGFFFPFEFQVCYCTSCVQAS